MDVFVEKLLKKEKKNSERTILLKDRLARKRTKSIIFERIFKKLTK